MKKMPLVSVIITTKNEEASIKQCLSSLADQTYQQIESIVVDNHSTDQTVSIAKKYASFVYDKGPERSAQRNFGASKAKGVYLLFLDADMILTPTVIEECVQKIQDRRPKNEKLVALVIPERSIGTGFWAKCKALERSFYEGVDWIEAARFYEKKTFSLLDGYDETLTGPEDFDFPQRLKKQFGSETIGRIQSYILHNEGHLSLGKTLKKKYYYGKGMQTYLAKEENKYVGMKQGNIFARYFLFFSHPMKLFSHPIVFFGMLLMKTLELGAIFLGYILS